MNLCLVYSCQKDEQNSNENCQLTKVYKSNGNLQYSYEYNESDLIQKKHYHSNGAFWATDNYTYNSNNQVESILKEYANDSSYLITFYEYQGLLLKKVISENPMGQSVYLENYIYDSENRLHTFLRGIPYGGPMEQLPVDLNDPILYDYRDNVNYDAVFVEYPSENEIILTYHIFVNMEECKEGMIREHYSREPGDQNWTSCKVYYCNQLDLYEDDEETPEEMEFIYYADYELSYDDLPAINNPLYETWQPIIGLLQNTNNIIELNCEKRPLTLMLFGRDRDVYFHWDGEELDQAHTIKVTYDYDDSGNLIEYDFNLDATPDLDSYLDHNRVYSHDCTK